MHDAMRQPGQSAKGGRVIQIAEQRSDTNGTQVADSVGTAGERDQLHAPLQASRYATAHVTTTHNQNALAAKASRQRARTGGVQMGMGALN